MAVNPPHVDKIVASASSDDTEVKLLKLHEEVELIKTSIKRLLIDIRERMNDLENPIVVPGGRGDPGEGSAPTGNVNKNTSGLIEAAAGPPLTTSQVTLQKDHDQAYQVQATTHAPSQSPVSDIDLFSALKSQLATLPKEDPVTKAALNDKVRLQKVFRLFEWTNRNVKRFGHDRVDLMLEAYHAMGYISDQSCKLVKDMTRLMPTSIGELHEIKADEFVSELYELNHILDPSDSTLDRDMIEVLMEKREGKDTTKLLSPARQPEDGAPNREYLPSRDRI